VTKFTARHQPAVSTTKAVLAGVGGLISIALAGAITHVAEATLLMAPFGATCVLLYSAPQSPLSQPANVVGGHVLSALIGLVLASLLPTEWWAVALAVGGAITLMALCRVTHPPAGASPIIVFALQPDFDFLLFPVLLGALLMVLSATLFHRLSKTAYPIEQA
jgi:CBS-domain-containing membrane protein